VARDGVAVTVEAHARAPVERTFAAIAPIDLPIIFRGFGPLPAVAGTREQTGDWDHVGATRVVELADGSEARERLTVYAAPGHFAYRVGPFSGPLRRLIDHADGAWWFTAAGDGATEVRWTYVFRPRSRLTAPVVRLAIAPLWRAYAGRALALAIRHAEGAPPEGQGD
jgi:polyketide cyclase/dehydrase/lipid transport protein